MSRTLHHIRYQHWNVKHTVAWVYPSWCARPGVNEEEETLGVVIYDLRFHAGRKRVPQKIRKERWDMTRMNSRKFGGKGYMKSWGHEGGVAHDLAKEYWGRRRMEDRAFTGEAVKYRRGGEKRGVADMVEPEGRTRHMAVYDAF